jgi:hypothetical protein
MHYKKSRSHRDYRGTAFFYFLKRKKRDEIIGGDANNGLEICIFVANFSMMSTLNLSPQYITDASGQRTSVVISMTNWQKILEMVEELEDIRMYDEAKNRQETRMSLTEYLATRKTRNLA